MTGHCFSCGITRKLISPYATCEPCLIAWRHGNEAERRAIVHAFTPNDQIHPLPPARTPAHVEMNP